MSSDTQPRIVAVNRLNRGVIISFDDGRCAFFSEALLYEALPKAEEVDEAVVDW